MGFEFLFFSCVRVWECVWSRCAYSVCTPAICVRARALELESGAATAWVGVNGQVVRFSKSWGPFVE